MQQSSTTLKPQEIGIGVVEDCYMLRCITLWCWVHGLSRQVGTLLSQDRVIGAMVCVCVNVELYIGGCGACIEWVEFV